MSNAAADVDCDYDEAGAIGSVLEKLNPRPSPQTDCMIMSMVRPVRSGRCSRRLEPKWLRMDDDDDMMTTTTATTMTATMAAATMTMAGAILTGL